MGGGGNMLDQCCAGTGERATGGEGWDIRLQQAVPAHPIVRATAECASPCTSTMSVMVCAADRMVTPSVIPDTCSTASQQRAEP